MKSSGIYKRTMEKSSESEINMTELRAGNI